jgi:hypothetical protein
VCNKDSKYHKWEPKEEEKVEKLYTTVQMIDMLLDNPKITVKTDIYEDDWNVIVGENGFILLGNNEYGYDTLCLTRQCLGAKWRIIEPEPKKVDIDEALIAYIKHKKIKSVISNDIYSTSTDEDMSLLCMTEKEIKDKWIILD